MNITMSLILVGLTTLAVTWISRTAAKVKNEESGRVDTGTALNYHRLSYRRRMRRSLWTIPFGIVVLTVALISTGTSARTIIIFSAVLLPTSLIQIGYNYIKWKKTNGEPES